MKLEPVPRTQAHLPRGTRAVSGISVRWSATGGREVLRGKL